MRKTLTAIVVVLAAGSLAACKMPWDKEKDPPATPVAVSPEAPTPDTTAIAETPKPAEQTASTEPAKPATPAAPQTAPATK
jgi:hypothetical protein